MHREQGNLFPMFANCCIVACANHREHPDFLKTVPAYAFLAGRPRNTFLIAM